MHQVVRYVDLMESSIAQFISSSLCLCIRWLFLVSDMHQVVRYVDLMESSIAQSIHKGFEKERWEIKG